MSQDAYLKPSHTDEKKYVVKDEHTAKSPIDYDKINHDKQVNIVEEDDTEEDIHMKQDFIMYVRSKAPPEFFTTWTDEQRSEFANDRLAEFEVKLKHDLEEKVKFERSLDMMKTEFPKVATNHGLFSLDAWKAALPNDLVDFLNMTEKEVTAHADHLDSFAPCQVLECAETAVHACTVPGSTSSGKTGEHHVGAPVIFREAFAAWLAGDQAIANAEDAELGSCPSCVQTVLSKLSVLYPTELRSLSAHMLHPIPGVFRFRMLNNDFCRNLSQLLVEAEVFAKNNDLVMKGPNSMNKYGMLLNAVGLGDVSDYLVTVIVQLLNIWTLPYMVFQRRRAECDHEDVMDAASCCNEGDHKTSGACCGTSAPGAQGAAGAAAESSMSTASTDKSVCCEKMTTEDDHHHAECHQIGKWMMVPLDAHYGFSVHYISAKAEMARVVVAGDEDTPASLSNVATEEAVLQRSASENADRLALHVDAADVTLNVCLGMEGFEGGGLILEGIRCPSHAQYECGVTCGENGSATTPDMCLVDDAVYRVNNEIGYAFIHHGQHRHRALPTTTGERMNLVLWANASGLYSSVVSQEFARSTSFALQHQQEKQTQDQPQDQEKSQRLLPSHAACLSYCGLHHAERDV